MGVILRINVHLAASPQLEARKSASNEPRRAPRDQEVPASQLVMASKGCNYFGANRPQAGIRHGSHPLYPSTMWKYENRQARAKGGGTNASRARAWHAQRRDFVCCIQFTYLEGRGSSSQCIFLFQAS